MHKEGKELFEIVKEMIQDDIDNGLEVEILEETEHSIIVYDNEDFIDRTYEIVNTDIMDSNWLKEKTIITPSVNELVNIDIDKLLEWMNDNVDKAMYMNLNNIIFINDEERDFDYLQNQSNELYNALECNNLPSEHQLGLMWFEESSVIVSVGNIVKTTENMLNNGEIYNWEANDCINFGITSTLLHEIRHLCQSNPYLIEEILQQTEKDDEIDAEQYARKICEEKPCYIILNNENIIEKREEEELEY